MKKPSSFALMGTKTHPANEAAKQAITCCQPFGIRMATQLPSFI
jgi:hypothetical protein